MALLLLLLLLLLLVESLPQTAPPSFFQQGSCAPFHLMDGFQMDQYVGKWYVVFQVPSGYLTLTECIADHLSLTENGLAVRTSGRTSQGDVSSSRAALIYHGGGGDDGARPFLQLKAPFVPPVPYHVVYTDYGRVSCAYSCLGVMGVKGEVFWVLSRGRSLRPGLLQRCLRAFASEGLDTGRLRQVDQGRCGPTRPRPSTPAGAPPQPPTPHDASQVLLALAKESTGEEDALIGSGSPGIWPFQPLALGLWLATLADRRVLYM